MLNHGGPHITDLHYSLVVNFFYTIPFDNCISDRAKSKELKGTKFCCNQLHWATHKILVLTSWILYPQTFYLT